MTEKNFIADIYDFLKNNSLAIYSFDNVFKDYEGNYGDQSLVVLDKMTKLYRSLAVLDKETIAQIFGYISSCTDDYIQLSDKTLTTCLGVRVNYNQIYRLIHDHILNLLKNMKMLASVNCEEDKSNVDLAWANIEKVAHQAIILQNPLNEIQDRLLHKQRTPVSMTPLVATNEIVVKQVARSQFQSSVNWFKRQGIGSPTVVSRVASDSNIDAVPAKIKLYERQLLLMKDVSIETSPKQFADNLEITKQMLQNIIALKPQDADHFIERFVEFLQDCKELYNDKEGICSTVKAALNDYEKMLPNKSPVVDF